MKIEINDKYIDWIKSQIPESAKQPMTEKEIEDYVNEVLDNHKQSWDDLEEDNI